jgi:hypothetical protein
MISFSKQHFSFKIKIKQISQLIVLLQNLRFAMNPGDSNGLSGLGAGQRFGRRISNFLRLHSEDFQQLPGATALDLSTRPHSEVVPVPDCFSRPPTPGPGARRRQRRQEIDLDHPPPAYNDIFPEGTPASFLAPQTEIVVSSDIPELPPRSSRPSRSRRTADRNASRSRSNHTQRVMILEHYNIGVDPSQYSTLRVETHGAPYVYIVVPRPTIRPPSEEPDFSAPDLHRLPTTGRDRIFVPDENNEFNVID